MIGAVEIIFSLMMFLIIWFIIFKLKLMLEEKKRLKNIDKKIEVQELKVSELIESIKNTPKSLPGRNSLNSNFPPKENSKITPREAQNKKKFL